MKSAVASIVVLLLTVAPAANAEVVEATAAGFTVKSVVDVKAPAAQAYRALVDVASWWDPEHTYSGSSANLSLVASPGGCFCERLAKGGAVEHARVIYVEPGKRLRMRGGLGPLQELAVTGVMTFTFSESAGTTSVEMIYRVSGDAPGGLDSIAPIVDQVLAGQVRRLGAVADRRKP